MKTLCSLFLGIILLLLASSPANGFASEPGKKMDTAKHIEWHQERAAKMREGADKMSEELKKRSFPSDKTPTVEEMISIGRQMADLHDQAAAALQRKDMEGAKAVLGKYKDLETRKMELCKQMGWDKSDRKGDSHKEGRKETSRESSADKPRKDTPGTTSVQSEAELQQWLGDNPK